MRRWLNPVFATLVAGSLATVPQFPAPAAPPTGVGVTGEVTSYVVRKGDTLRALSARFGVDAATIAAANRRPLNRPLAIGETLVIGSRHIVPAELQTPGYRLVVNVPQRLVWFADEGGARAFPVAVGKRTWATPRGEFHIAAREENPTWDVPASIREEARRAGKSLPATVPPGPDNPLGRYWLGLSISGIGIHGTNAPASIYQAVTHGCLRAGAEDIAWLYDHVDVGMRGRIIYAPVLLAVVEREVWLEVHPDVYRRLPRGLAAEARAQAEAAGLASAIDWERAEAAVTAHEGVARVVGRLP